MKDIRTIGVCGTLAVLLFASTTPAAAVTISSISGVWDKSVPENGVSGQGTSQLRWGTPFEQPDQSGYDFSGSAPPVFSVVPGFEFIVGTFTHLNNAIVGTTLESTDLLLSLSFSDGRSASSTFRFFHDETDNAANPCAFGGPKGTGVNLSGCADRVQVSLDVTDSSPVTLDGEQYFLDFQAFSFEGTLQSSFLTAEDEANEAFVLGTLRKREEINIAPIPIPASALLLMGGLAGMASIRGLRRRA